MSSNCFKIRISLEVYHSDGIKRIYPPGSQIAAQINIVHIYIAYLDYCCSKLIFSAKQNYPFKYWP